MGIPEPNTRIGIYIFLMTFTLAIQHRSVVLLISAMVTLFILTVIIGVFKMPTTEKIEEEVFKIRINHWVYHDAEVYGRAMDKDNFPIRTGEAFYIDAKVDEPEVLQIPLSEYAVPLKEGDLLVNIYGVYFELMEPGNG